MGQRHQIFLIARIRCRDATTSRYRCVAAYHHQWLYGRLPLAAASSFITLLKKEENASIAAAELTSIGSSYGEDECYPEKPAPFLSSLLSATLSVQMERHYSSFSICPLDANVGSLDGDNNDGLTVIDVTNTFSPAYCFVSICGLEATGHVDDCVPLTAEAYVRAYYPVGSEDSLASMDEEERISLQAQNDDVEELITLFKDVKLIESWMLHETWPEDGYDDTKPDSETTDFPGTETGMPPLTELCLQKAVEHAETHQDIAALEAAATLPGLRVMLLDVLAERDHVPDMSMGPMIEAFSESKRDNVLDLSRYSLTAEQIIQIATHFPQTQVLNLSNNPHITCASLRQLLPYLLQLTRLIIYDCPGVSASDIRTLRYSGVFTELQAVYHRDYMMYGDLCENTQGDKNNGSQLEVTDVACTPRASFTFALDGAPSSLHLSDMRSLTGYTVPFLSPPTIVVSLCDIFNYLSWTGFGIETNVIRACGTSLPRAADVPFAERVIGNVPGNLLLCPEGWMFLLCFKGAKYDAMFSPTRLRDPVHGFVKYKFPKSSRQGQNSSSPPEVEVMNFGEWLAALNVTDKVGKEWVERLRGYLEQSPLISKERVGEVLARYRQEKRMQQGSWECR